MFSMLYWQMETRIHPTTELMIAHCFSSAADRQGCRDRVIIKALVSSSPDIKDRTGKKFLEIDILGQLTFHNTNHKNIPFESNEVKKLWFAGR